MAELTPHHLGSSSPPSTFSSLGATDCAPQQIPYTGLFPAYHYPTPTDSPFHQQDELPLPPFAPQPAYGGFHSGGFRESQHYGSFTSQPNPNFHETFFKSEPGTQHGYQPLPQFHSHYHNNQYRQHQRPLSRRTYTPPPHPRSPITARKLLMRINAIAPSSCKGNNHTTHRSSSLISSGSGSGSGTDSSNNNGSKRLPSLGPIQQSDELVWRGQMRGFEVLWSCEDGRGPGNGQRRMRGALERFLAGGEMELGLGLGM